MIAVALLDGTVSFDDSHSYERMKDPRVLAAGNAFSWWATRR